MSAPPGLRTFLLATTAPSSWAAWVAGHERRPTGPDNMRGYSNALRDRILAFVGSRELHDITAAAVCRRIKLKVNARTEHLVSGGWSTGLAMEHSLHHYGLTCIPDRRTVGKALEWRRTHVDVEGGPRCTSMSTAGVPAVPVALYAGLTSPSTS